MVVDDELWKQICSYDDTPISARQEIVSWLCCPDADRTKACEGIERQGNVLEQFYTQRHVIEKKKLDGIVGVLFLP